MHYWDFYSLFNKYKKDCSIFFETGTHQGESVNDALTLGFEKIISVEIVETYYKQCFEMFKNNPKVNLFFGDSNELMPEMLKLVDKKSLFFLDAHKDGVTTLWGELELLKNHPIKTHTIIVDDMHSWFLNDLDAVKDSLLEINPNYFFVMEKQVKCNATNTYSNADAHLVAYIP
jgi:hypothetical protein